MNNDNNARYWLLLSIAVILADQLSKWWLNMTLPPYQSIPVIPMLNLTLVYNSGAAFNFLNDAGGWQRWFLVTLTIIVITILLNWLWHMRTEERLQALSVSLILGGAIGNLIDRVWLGYVIDFLDVYYQTYHWPVFNIADSAITIGAILLIYDMFTNHHEDNQNSG